MLEIVNCTIANNVALGDDLGAGGGGVYLDHLDSESAQVVEIANTIIWGNVAETDPSIGGEVSAPTVNNSIVDGGWTGTGSGNLDEKPQFVSPTTGNYALFATSPAIDAGENDDLPCNEFGLDPNEEVDALGGCPPTQDNPSGRKHPIDLADNQRVFNLPDTDVDMGAFEFQCEVAACPGDFNDDGTVDVSDILEMLAVFGPCPAPCPADLNCDGNVNVTDLLGLLGAFGPCPALGSEDPPEDVYDCMDRYEVGTEEFEKCIEWIEERENYLE